MDKQAVGTWKIASILVLFFLFCLSSTAYPWVDRVGILIRELKTGNDWRRRTRAAVELGRIKHPRVVKPLIDALEDKHWTVRRSAAEALGRIGDRRAIRSLIGALEDENSEVRKKAANALATIKGKNFGQDPFKWQIWWETTVRK